MFTNYLRSLSFLGALFIFLASPNQASAAPSPDKNAEASVSAKDEALTVTLPKNCDPMSGLFKVSGGRVVECTAGTAGKSDSVTFKDEVYTVILPKDCDMSNLFKLRGSSGSTCGASGGTGGSGGSGGTTGGGTGGSSSTNCNLVTSGPIAGALRISPCSLTFANQAVGSTSPSQGIDVINIAPFPTNLITTPNGMAVTGDFRIQNNSCGGLAPPGMSCGVNLVFTPTAVGPRSGVVTIIFSDSMGNQRSTTQIPLSGTGISGAAGTGGSANGGAGSGGSGGVSGSGGSAGGGGGSAGSSGSGGDGASGFGGVGGANPASSSPLSVGRCTATPAPQDAIVLGGQQKLISSFGGSMSSVTIDYKSATIGTNSVVFMQVGGVPVVMNSQAVQTPATLAVVPQSTLPQLSVQVPATTDGNLQFRVYEVDPSGKAASVPADCSVETVGVSAEGGGCSLVRASRRASH